MTAESARFTAPFYPRARPAPARPRPFAIDGADHRRLATGMAKKTVTKAAETPLKPVETVDPLHELLTIRTLQAKHAACSAADVADFDGHADTSERVAMGEKTVALLALRDLTSMAVAIDEQFTNFGPAVEQEYPRARFRYFLDRLEVLARQLSDATGRKEARVGIRDTAAGTEQGALNARDTLLRKMKRFGKRRAEEKAALAELPLMGDDTNARLVYMRSQTKLARTWLARDAQKGLLASAGLNAAVVKAVESGIEALTRGASDATLAGRGSANDPPQVNLVEGWATLEAEVAVDAFVDVHESSGGVVPKLLLGPHVKHALQATHAKVAGAVSDATPKPPVPA